MEQLFGMVEIARFSPRIPYLGGGKKLQMRLVAVTDKEKVKIQG
jgi:hypothetical protein